MGIAAVSLMPADHRRLARTGPAWRRPGYAAMLPPYGLAVAAARKGDPAGTVALTIVVAQSVMALASIVALRMAGSPGLVARILDGTGRINVGQGAVMTVQGIGASLSPALGRARAQAVGYRISFVILGAFAVGSLALWLAFRRLVTPASENPPAAAAA